MQTDDTDLLDNYAPMPPFSEPPADDVGVDAVSAEHGIDPRDGRAMEIELEALVSRLADDMSELALVKLLPRAKALYEQLHPAAKHGGRREEQAAESATCPSFAAWAAKRVGISQRSIYTRLEHADALKTLDPDAEAACYGTALANKIGFVVRIARIPKPEIHRDIVNVYKSAGPKKAKVELCAWEHEFGCAPEPRPAPDPTPLGPEPETAHSGAIGPAPASEDHETARNEAAIVAAIMNALEVATLAECVPAIEGLRSRSYAEPGDPERIAALNASIDELRALRDQGLARIAELERELTMHRTTPMGELLTLLGAKTVRGALKKARALKANDA